MEKKIDDYILKKFPQSKKINNYYKDSINLFTTYKLYSNNQYELILNNFNLLDKKCKIPNMIFVKFYDLELQEKFNTLCLSSKYGYCTYNNTNNNFLKWKSFNEFINQIIFVYNFIQKNIFK
jgi:hypothetical protein